MLELAEEGNLTPAHSFHSCTVRSSHVQTHLPTFPCSVHTQLLGEQKPLIRSTSKRMDQGKRPAWALKVGLGPFGSGIWGSSKPRAWPRWGQCSRFSWECFWVLQAIDSLVKIKMEWISNKMSTAKQSIKAGVASAWIQKQYYTEKYKNAALQPIYPVFGTKVPLCCFTRLTTLHSFRWPQSYWSTWQPCIWHSQVFSKSP